MNEEEDRDWIGLYSWEEINEKHVTQLSTSGCGATAVVNVLLLLNLVRKDQLQDIDWSVCILRNRANSSPIFPYLLSRHNAGCTGEELIQSMHLLFERNRSLFTHAPTISGRFFSYRDIQDRSITEFLAEHIQQGHVPIATMNLQLLGNDAWHHQIIFAVSTSQRIIHMLNPLDEYPEPLVQRLISTQNILLVRRNDVMSRLTAEVREYASSYYHIILEREEKKKLGILTKEQIIEEETADEEIHRRLYGDSIFLEDPWKSFHIIRQITMMINQPDIAYLVIPAAYTGGFAIFESSP
eukprot:gene3981-4260_t